MEKQKIKVGQLLVSEPFLQSLYFNRAVVLIVRHDEDGTIGFIINRITDLDISYVLDEIKFAECPLHFGGPDVTEIVHFLHRVKDLPDATEIMAGIYWGGDINVLVERLNNGSIDIEDIKFFAGHSYWIEGEVEREINNGMWLSCDSLENLIFTDETSDLWSDLLSTIGSNYAVLGKFPYSPSLN